MNGHLKSITVKSKPLNKSSGEPADVLLGAMLIVYGIGLNHANVVAGVNMSLADPIAIATILLLLARGKLFLPVHAVLLFAAITLTTIPVSLFLVPSWLSEPASILSIVRDYIKLCASFVSFIIGIEVVKSAVFWRLGRGFVFGAAAISALAVVAQLIPTIRSSEMLFYGGFRFHGLMNDPNYYAVISMCAVAILWREPRISTGLRSGITVMIFLGILSSGSKTGLIILISWALARLWLWRHDESVGFKHGNVQLAKVFFGLTGLLGIGIVTNEAVLHQIEPIIARFPALDRVSLLLSDFDSALMEGGSGRDTAWSGAINLIELSPILGVGLGSYSQVSKEVNGAAVLAHNTYLQLVAEWGLVLFLVLVALVARILVRRPKVRALLVQWVAARDVFIVLLVGSVGLSLNNSRLFWLTLGVLAGCYLFDKDRARTESS